MSALESWVAACSHLAPKDASRPDPAPVRLWNAFLRIRTADRLLGKNAAAAGQQWLNIGNGECRTQLEREGAAGIRLQWKFSSVERAPGRSGIGGFYTLGLLSSLWLHLQLCTTSAPDNAGRLVGAGLSLLECFWNSTQGPARHLPVGLVEILRCVACSLIWFFVAVLRVKMPWKA